MTLSAPMTPSPEAGLQHEPSSMNAELADFLFRSYYFSQGKPRLQRRLIDYAREYYGPAALSALSQQDRDEIRQIATTRVTSWVERGPHAKLGARNLPVPTLVASIEQSLRFGTGKRATANGLAYETGREMIHADYHSIVESDGRQNRRGNPRNVFQDPFLSHVVHYGLLRNDAYSPAANFAFDKVSDVLVTGLVSPGGILDDEPASDAGTTGPSLSQKLAALLAMHLEHHPEAKLSVEEALATHF